jgi:DNA-nicking Smr family endonuclease
MERRTARALARGRRRPEAVLDLHGLTQAEAHARLIAFLRRAQAEGRSMVVVITGRGGRTSGAAAPGVGERGVLRRMAPHWLRLPELRSLVLGFEEAGPRQGGGGALYVQLRRARSP